MVDENEVDVNNMSGSAILQVENLAFDYGRAEVWRDVEFEIAQGEIVFLVGQNGSGKSTLLRCLAGIAKQKAGEIFLLGRRFAGISRMQRAQISFVSDAPVFYDDLSAEEHIKFVLSVNRKNDDYTLAMKLLEDFGLTGHIKQYPSSFSRGMREKLALVIALIINPSLYLLDEPYGPLDGAASKMLSHKIKECISRGSSVILSCHHDIPDLKPDRVFLLDDTRLVEKDSSILGQMWGVGLPHDMTAANEFHTI